ncbi:MAG: thiamine diphosphokinase [Mucilaginibacter sp.]|nr:thiamine diphosphokinase [Mucilaginibacter sp.]
MSSHHIVREKQEPALLVLGLDSFPFELLGQLLEWSPTVIATRQTAELLNNQGIKIDWVISNDTHSSLQSDIKQMPAGNDSLAEAALKYLITHGYPAVNIIADDLQLKDYLFYTDKINLVIFHGNQKIYAVNSGFSKWKPAGEMVEVLTHPHDLHLSGLEPLGNHNFRTTHDGFFSLQFEHPFLFIAEGL